MAGATALVSLTNLDALPPRRIGALAVVDFDTRRANHVASMHPSIREHFGATGLIRVGDGYAMLVQSVPTQAIVLDASFDVVAVYDLPLISDPHSLALMDDMWFALSTGSDSIVAVDPATGRHSVVWRAPTGGVDILHVNSIFSFEGGLCVSAMCRRGGSLAASVDGIVVNLHTGETLMRPLFHPHSARERDGQIVVCESSRGRVVSTSGSTLDVPLGYVRGLDITDKHIFVGTSRRRQPPVGRCTVQLFERIGPEIGDAQRATTVHIGELGPEVFDVVAL